jgi:rSAM/selenodomain-associated transferase 2
LPTVPSLIELTATVELKLTDTQEAELHRLLRFYNREAERCSKARAFLAGCVMAGAELETALMLMVDIYPEDEGFSLQPMPTLSIIIPVLDEAATIAGALAALEPCRARHAEIIVVDGGSRDGTVEAVRRFADRVMTAPRGRGSQMNAGAAAAHGDVLLFLHADTRLPADADRLVVDTLEQSNRVWGRFDVTIAGRSPFLRVVAAMMNLRSRITGIATGDQAMFMTRAAFAQAGGFPDIPLMEDIVLSRRLKRLGRPACLAARATTSGRRWDRDGVVRTVVTMWRLRLAFFLGAEPARLARRYGYGVRDA